MLRRMKQGSELPLTVQETKRKPRLIFEMLLLVFTLLSDEKSTFVYNVRRFN